MYYVVNRHGLWTFDNFRESTAFFVEFANDDRGEFAWFNAGPIMR